MAGYSWRKDEPRTPSPPPEPEPPRKPGRPKGSMGTKPFDPTKCGTMPGWRQHRAHGQKECRPCMNAQNEYMREYTAKKKRHKGAA